MDVYRLHGNGQWWLHVGKGPPIKNKKYSLIAPDLTVAMLAKKEATFFLLFWHQHGHLPSYHVSAIKEYITQSKSLHFKQCLKYQLAVLLLEVHILQNSILGLHVTQVKT